MATLAVLKARAAATHRDFFITEANVGVNGVCAHLRGQASTTKGVRMLRIERMNLIPPQLGKCRSLDPTIPQNPARCVTQASRRRVDPPDQFNPQHPNTPRRRCPAWMKKASEPRMC